MPIYDFKCPEGHFTEKRANMNTQSILCPACGQDAVRVPFYATVELITETGVGSGYAQHKEVGSEVKDRHGRVRLDLFEEASAEMEHHHEKAQETIGRKFHKASPYRQASRLANQLAARGYRSRHLRRSSKEP